MTGGANALARYDAKFEGEFDAAHAELPGAWSQRGRTWPLVFRKA